MKVRTAVKAICPSCVKIRIQVTRDKGYTEIKCKKNPRHNQRQKWATVSTSAIEGSASTSQQTSQYCAYHQGLSMMSLPQNRPGISGLLASRQTACLGQLYWQSAASGEDGY
mmetsp:Transcript_4896/g.10509  ORF Transcript_4896/g.10509 Transcript_4896/m.10509 type:complete len:112 (-) Transcript_4896:600-935(-)